MGGGVARADVDFDVPALPYCELSGTVGGADTIYASTFSLWDPTNKEILHEDGKYYVLAVPLPAPGRYSIAVWQP